MKTILATVLLLVLAGEASAQCVGGVCFGRARERNWDRGTTWDRGWERPGWGGGGWGGGFQTLPYSFAPERPFLNLSIRQRGLFGRRQSIDLSAPGVNLRLRR